MFRSVSLPHARGLVLAACLLAPAALAQEPRAAFHEAYWLEHERGDLEGALSLYRQVADSRRADADLRGRADRAARGIAEELAAADLARLVPADTIAYLELDRPGEQVARLLEQLGLLGRAGEIVPEGLAISPLLVEHALGLRGAAVAITGIVPGGEPSGVLVLDPGRHDGLRGLIDTALPAGGLAVDPIGGFPAWSVEGEAVVCLTERLLVASRDPRQIEAVVERLQGRREGSLASNPAFRHALDGGRQGLVRFFVNAEPLKPLMRMAVEQAARQDPGAAMAAGMLDLESLQSLSGRLGVDQGGLALELALDLADGHRNLVFDLLRRPAVGRDTLELVPEGAAFFLASAFNPPASVAPIARDAGGRPVVSLLDFGREWFGNVVDAALVGMPPRPDAGPGLPDVALVLRSNDVERSQALWDLLLTTAGQAAGAPPARDRVGGIEATRYALQGVPVYLASAGDRLVLALQRGAIERALAPQGAGVAGDPVFEHALHGLDASPTMLVLACPGRCAEMALPFAPGRDATQLVPLVDLLGETALSLVVQHSDTRLALSARLHQVPDVSGMVAQALSARKRAAVGAGAGDRRALAAAPAAPSRPVASVRTIDASAPAAASASSATKQAKQAKQAKQEQQAKQKKALREQAADSAAPADPQVLRARFDQRVEADELDAARRVGDRIVATVADPVWLNDFAWAVLTEEAYGGRLDDVARVLARRSNELSGHANWYHLDTLALAEFRCGDVRRAVELQAEAVERAAGDPRQAEAVERLQQYTAALREAKPTVRAGQGGPGG